MSDAELRIMLGAAATKGQPWDMLQRLPFVDLVDLDACLAAFFKTINPDSGGGHG